MDDCKWHFVRLWENIETKNNEKRGVTHSKWVCSECGRVKTLEFLE